MSSKGTVKGVVKKYSGVGDRLNFTIVPNLGAEVKCVFPKALTERAAAAVEKNVRVDGEVRRYAGSMWPHEVSVSEIQVLKPDSELAKLSELKGIAPDATGDMSTADFINELRYGW